MTTKTPVKPCVKCGSTDRRPTRLDGRIGDCRPCQNQQRSKWTHDQLVKPCLKCGSIERYKKRPNGNMGVCANCARINLRNTTKSGNREAYNRERTLQYRYGISTEQYDVMVMEQCGKCGICQEVPSSKLQVDHNHATGAVRGLLCRTCNVGIGSLKDKAEVLQNALHWVAI